VILLRLAIPAVAGWATAFVLVSTPGLRAGVAIGLWLLAVLLAVGVVLIAPGGPLMRHWWMIVCLVVIVAALTATSAAVHGAARRPPLLDPLIEAKGGGVAVLTVRIDGPPDTATAGSIAGGLVARERTRATLLAIAPPGPARTAAPDDGHAGAGGAAPVETGMEAGAVVAVPVLLFSSGGLLAPGGADGPDRSNGGDRQSPADPRTSPARAAAPPIGTVLRLSGTARVTEPEDDVSLLVYVRGDSEVLDGPPWWLAWASRLRTDFSAAAARLPGDGADLLPGLVVGDTSAVDDRLEAALKQSSLTHLTAVSGANCAIVVGAVLAVASAMGCRRGVRVGACLVALTGFVVLVTPEPSVLRAAVMAAVVLVAVVSGRPLRGIPPLALAVIVLLVTDPWLSRSYGFALSVLATAGLLLLSGPLTRALSRLVPSPVAAVIALPLAAQAACQPVLILLTPTLPVYGVPANILAAPAVPLATVVGMVAIAILPWAPPLGAAVVTVAWAPAVWISAVATTTAGLPDARVPWLDGVPGALLLAGVTVLMLVAVLGGDRRRLRRARVACGVGAVVAIGVYVGGHVGSGLRDRLSIPADWQYAACDVGQGDAVLVRSLGKVALVDVGPDPVPLEACLTRLGVERIDLLVLTHYDLDHVGGSAAVLGRVGAALVGPVEVIEDQRLVDRLRAAGAAVTVATAGMSGTLGGLDWTVLWPVNRGLRTLTGNPGSVTMTFEAGSRCPGECLTSAFLGDLGEESQNALLRTLAPAASAQSADPSSVGSGSFGIGMLDPGPGRVGSVDIVKVAHHGSADQSARLYERLSATAGIISVGADNTYGHPTASALAMLRSAGTAALRTDQRGLMVLAPGTQPGTITAWSDHPDPAIVKPDG